MSYLSFPIFPKVKELQIERMYEIYPGQNLILRKTLVNSVKVTLKALSTFSSTVSIQSCFGLT